ncbi:LamG domain-containing protein [Phenylobacterium sp.]|uniref:LamG domain-containing protein n=1 Tax=Phenylobacterium sp. TaxID=1871053 RepID=UPI0035B31226
MRAGTFPSRRELVAGAGAALAVSPAAARAPSADSVVWRFDNLRRIGGRPAEALGAPAVVRAPGGRALAFDGVDDGLVIPEHPLAGAAAFTIEALVRPDGGRFEQRWLHLAEDPALAASAGVGGGTRMLFEVRVAEAGWYLDAFIKGPGYNQALMAPEKLHPLGQWRHVAQVCDGRRYASFVDGVLQAEAAVAFTPQGPGRTSAGVRMNRIDWFRGAIAEARFTRRALSPAEFRMRRR